MTVNEILVDAADHDGVAVIDVDFRQVALDQADVAITIHNVPFLHGIPSFAEHGDRPRASLWPGFDPAGVLDVLEHCIRTGVRQSRSNVGDGVDIGVKREHLKTAGRVAAGERLTE